MHGTLKAKSLSIFACIAMRLTRRHVVRKRNAMRNRSRLRWDLNGCEGLQHELGTRNYGGYSVALATYHSQYNAVCTSRSRKGGEHDKEVLVAEDAVERVQG